MRNPTLRNILVAASIGALPSALAAQQPAKADTLPQTHTVVKGETLWGLAQQFLTDPFRWPEIYNLNKPAIADPHWIYPGQVLRVPGSVTGVTITMAPAAGLSPVAVVDTGAKVDTVARAVDTTAKAVDTTAKAVDTAAALSQSQEIATMGHSTVFIRPEPPARPFDGVGFEKTPVFPTVRSGEYVRAPYVLPARTAVGVGRVIKSAELDPNGDVSSTSIFQAYDRVLITLPGDASAKAGDRFVVLSRADELPSQGQVMVPTGVVEITQMPTDGAAGVARVVQLFGEMHPDQVLVPFDTAAIGTTQRPAPVKGGRWASITWILASPVLPTVQGYAVLDITS
ncbi:MAG: LysM peptidoglycan-binding domain-containing protein, partial [Gemmatimonadaceae bacterium]